MTSGQGHAAQAMKREACFEGGLHTNQIYERPPILSTYTAAMQSQSDDARERVVICGQVASGASDIKKLQAIRAGKPCTATGLRNMHASMHSLTRESCPEPGGRGLR